MAAASAAAGNIDGDTWGANMLPPGGAKPQVAAVLKRGSGSDTVPAVAAVLKPEYQAALDRHNKHRQTHQVRTQSPVYVQAVRLPRCQQLRLSVELCYNGWLSHKPPSDARPLFGGLSSAAGPCTGVG